MLVVSMCMHNKARKYLRIILNKNIVQTFILRSKTKFTPTSTRQSAVIEGNQAAKKRELLYTGDHSYEHVHNVVIFRDDTVKG